MSYLQIKDFRKYIKNPSKYVGHGPCTLRSSWEIKFATWLDKNPNCLEWAVEEIVIPYIFYDPKIRKNRQHRYFTDFWMKIRDKNGVIKEFLIEIKPHHETQPPKKSGRHTKKFSRTVFNYAKNQAKWQAAKQFCESLKENGRDIEFLVLTEKDLPV
jgi:hypothetical protein